MRETLPLLRLRWRHTQEELIYWVRSGLYYDPRKRTTAERLYGLYLLVLIVVVFLLPGWTELMATAAAAGHALPPQARLRVLGALPAVILCGQVLLAMAALRSSPFKLTYPDMAYVAGAPLPRGAAVLVGFLFTVTRRLLVAMLTAGLVSVALTQPAALGSATLTCGEAAVGMVPLAVLSWGVAWLAGCARVASYKVQRWRLLWLAPLVVLGVAALLPGALLWPGRALTLAMQGQVSSPVGLLALVATLAVAALTRVGNKVNMTLVAQESQVYARLQSLGLSLMTLFVAPGLSWQIRAQERRRAHKPRGRLPRAAGSWALVARAALSGLRHPFVLVRPLLWGVVATRLSAFLLLEHAQGRCGSTGLSQSSSRRRAASSRRSRPTRPSPSCASFCPLTPCGFCLQIQPPLCSTLGRGAGGLDRATCRAVYRCARRGAERGAGGRPRALPGAEPRPDYGLAHPHLVRSGDSHERRRRPCGRSAHEDARRPARGRDGHRSPAGWSARYQSLTPGSGELRPGSGNPTRRD